MRNGVLQALPYGALVASGPCFSLRLTKQLSVCLNSVFPGVILGSF